MSRSYSDCVFYKLLFVGLVFVVFLFTVVLTNVFVDVDYLIWTKDGDVDTLVASEDERILAFQDNNLEDVNNFKIKRSLTSTLGDNTVVNVTAVNNEGTPEKYHSQNTKKLLQIIYTRSAENLRNVEINHDTNLPIERVANYSVYDNNNSFISYSSSSLRQNKKLEYYEPISKESEKKRSKRHVRVRYRDESNHKKDENELFIESETHFDDKKINTDRKINLMKNTFDKIHKAKHTETEKEKTIEKSEYNENRTRIYNIIEQTHPVFTRSLNVIPKSIPTVRSVPVISVKSEENWKLYSGPSFFSSSKANKFAEVRGPLEYRKVVKSTEIPQRYLQPINTELSSLNINGKYLDVGNSKFLIKNENGTGLSIRFKQFVDDAPNLEKLKSFSKKDNLIKDYRQTEGNTVAINNFIDDKPKYAITSKEHDTKKRSVNDKDNEYKNLLQKEPFKLYQNYQEVIENKPTKVKNEDTEESKIDTITVDDKLFVKDLNPSEVYALPNIIERKKRWVSLKKGNKINLQRLIKGNGKIKGVLIKKPFTTKCDVEKIRIIASDHLPKLPSVQGSVENIYVHDNIFTEEPIAKKVGTAVSDTEYQPTIQHQYVDSQENILQINPLSRDRFRHNALKMKYPHIIYNGISHLEDPLDQSYKLYSSILTEHRTASVETDDMIKRLDKSSTDNIRPGVFNVPSNQVDELLNVMTLESPKICKLTIRVSPKNNTNNLGFKELQTTNNKTYNEDGLTYTSLVNVMQLTKFINATDSKLNTKSMMITPNVQDLESQPKPMQYKLRERKESLEKKIDYIRNQQSNVKVKIQSNITSNNNNYLDVVLTINPEQLLKKDDIAKLLTAAFLKSVNNETTTAPTTTQTSTTIISTTSSLTNTNGIKLYDKSYTNETITSQILSKLEKNTDLLREFVEKLSLTTSTNTSNVISKKKRLNGDLLPKDWNAPNGNLNDSLLPKALPSFPKMNDDTQTIPFLYAYKQPIDKTVNAMTSVFIHGHIHAKPIIKEFLHCTKNSAHENKDINKDGDKQQSVLKNISENKTKIPHDDIHPLRRNKNHTHSFYDGEGSNTTVESVANMN